MCVCVFVRACFSVGTRERRGEREGVRDSPVWEPLSMNRKETEALIV